ncbi:N-acetyl-beta-D-galactosaminidase [Aureococcus anophagefferens]|uniref:N-acetyl-beta-D-galactosaminidase n=1 Tax=Aureococcus anophagefferens TaxID=44056 RepID=A0ABR1FQ80_AURAN
MARLVEYGRLRGVAVMAEADSPGHAAPSWCRGNASHLCVASLARRAGRRLPPPLRPGAETEALVDGSVLRP